MPFDFSVIDVGGDVSVHPGPRTRWYAPVTFATPSESWAVAITLMASLGLTQTPVPDTSAKEGSRFGGVLTGGGGGGGGGGGSSAAVVVVWPTVGGGGAFTGDDGAAVVPVVPVGPGGSAVGEADGAAVAAELAAGAGRATPAGLAEHAAARLHATPAATTIGQRVAVMPLPRCRYRLPSSARG
jgi:hypothetical protein